MFIRSLGVALVVTATAHAILLGDALLVSICEPHMQALKTSLLALRHDLNCTLLLARSNLRWWTYEHFVMRPAYARDCAEMAVAYGIEADLHYGVLDESRWVNLCRYIAGYSGALFAPTMNEAFIDGWFRPMACTYCSKSGIKLIAQPVGATERDLLVGNERASFVLKDLAGMVMVEIAARADWTHRSLCALVDSKKIARHVARSGGADAYLGSVWIGGTEI